MSLEASQRFFDTLVEEYKKYQEHLAVLSGMSNVHDTDKELILKTVKSWQGYCVSHMIGVAAAEAKRLERVNKLLVGITREAEEEPINKEGKLNEDV